MEYFIGRQIGKQYKDPQVDNSLMLFLCVLCELRVRVLSSSRKLKSFHAKLAKKDVRRKPEMNQSFNFQGETCLFSVLFSGSSILSVSAVPGASTRFLSWKRIERKKAQIPRTPVTNAVSVSLRHRKKAAAPTRTTARI